MRHKRDLCADAQGGVQPAFTLQCISLPTYAACPFNPSTNNVAANATGTETVQITTTQSSGMAAPTPPGCHPNWNMIALACGLILLPLATKKRRRLPACFSLLVLAIVGASRCSSSGGGGGGAPPPTPASHKVAPGTYSIPLVVTSGSVKHMVRLTLVVA
jgi:hypothetical protein